MGEIVVGTMWYLSDQVRWRGHVWCHSHSLFLSSRSAILPKIKLKGFCIRWSKLDTRLDHVMRPSSLKPRHHELYPSCDVVMSG